MLRFAYLCSCVVFCLLLISATEKQAYAYVDPGSSLVLYQGASSIVLGVVYYFRRRLKALFVRQAPASALLEKVQK